MRTSIVVPWFGKYCRGGAEKLSVMLGHIFKDLGHDVEVLTTTVRSFDSDWSKPFYDEGDSVELGLYVRRFDPIRRDTRIFDEVNGRILDGQTLTTGEERVFLHENVNSLKLNSYIGLGESDLYVYLPYMFGPTLFGLFQNPGKNLLVPLLHDEGYAYLSVVARSLKLADYVVFLSNSEEKLFERIYGRPTRSSVVPVPIERHSQELDHSANRVEFEQYVLYAGRKDKGKNIGFLFDTVRRLKTSRIGCVLIGGGNVEIPPDISHQIVDLGYVSEDDKASLMEGALCLVHPSLFESFSISSVEANLYGVPVIVHSDCEVLADYVNASGGGIHVSESAQACIQIEEWSKHPELAAAIGCAGKEYVERHMRRDAILENYNSVLTEMGLKGGLTPDESRASSTEFSRA